MALVPQPPVPPTSAPPGGPEPLSGFWLGVAAAVLAVASVIGGLFKEIAARWRGIVVAHLFFLTLWMAIQVFFFATGAHWCVPSNGSRAVEWLTYVSSELHKSFGPLFGPRTPEEYKAFLREALATKYHWLNGALAGKKYLLGDDFSVADAYLYTILRWSKSAELDLANFPNLKAYYDRVEARPAVAAALAAEKPKA